MDQPIFVVGAPRSGTTLLQSILNAHPQIAIAPEEDWLLRLGRKYGDEQELSAGSVETFLDDLFSSRSFNKYWKMSREEARNAVARFGKDCRYSSVASAIYTQYASAVSETKARWGSKVPYYVMHVPALSRLFPSLQVIHITRDGRDVLMSMRERQAKGADHFVTSARLAALQWRRMVRTGQGEGARLGSRQYFEVRYEDLVTSPEPVVRAVCGFLRIAYSESMLDFYDNAVNNKLLHSDQVDRYLMKTIVKSKVGRWRAELSPSDVRTYESIAGPTLRANGYELSTRLTVLERIHGAAARMSYRAYQMSPEWLKARLKGNSGRSPSQPLHRAGFAGRVESSCG